MSRLVRRLDVMPVVREPGRVPLGVAVRLPSSNAASPGPAAELAELLSIRPASCGVRMLSSRRERHVHPSCLLPHVDGAITSARPGGGPGQAVVAPGWEWLGWSVAQHVAYWDITVAHTAPACAEGPLVIVPCGHRKQPYPAPASELYLGSYHAACRRAASRLTAAGGGTLILSARHGLLGLDPSEVVAPYEQRVDQPGAITPEQLRVQAAQRQVLDSADVIVLAGRGYVSLARQVWPHTSAPLQGSRGIGEQLSRLASIATSDVLYYKYLEAGADP